MSNELIINNDYCYLTLDKKYIIKLLYESLRFRPKNYFLSKFYKVWKKTKGKYGWNGYIEFFDIKEGRFPTGLLPEIVMALSNLKVKTNIIDNRTNKIQIKNIHENFLEGIELRDYQYQIANKAWEYERGIIKAATGAGKTILFISMIKSLPENTPILILFSSKSLVNQTYNELIKFDTKNVGRIHSGVFDPNYILCATIQSWKHYASLLKLYKVLIVDEVHEFATKNRTRIIKYMDNCRYRFGFSATPWNPGENVKKYQLKSWFGPVLGDITTQELQENEVLSKSRCYFHEIDKPNDIEDLDYRTAYLKGVVENIHMVNKIKEIIDSYKNGRILIIVEKIDHGDLLHQLIPNSIWVQGKDNDETREYVIKKLQTSKQDEKVIAIGTRILQTGVNIFVHGVINAAGYKSYIMTIQRIGRGLRKADDKDVLDYHDFVFNNNHYLNDHSKQRIKWLKKEGHPIYIKGNK